MCIQNTTLLCFVTANLSRRRTRLLYTSLLNVLSSGEAVTIECSWASNSFGHCCEYRCFHVLDFLILNDSLASNENVETEQFSTKQLLGLYVLDSFWPQSFVKKIWRTDILDQDHGDDFEQFCGLWIYLRFYTYFQTVEIQKYWALRGFFCRLKRLPNIISITPSKNSNAFNIQSLWQAGQARPGQAGSKDI